MRRRATGAAGAAIIALAIACSNYGPTSAVESSDWSAGTSPHVTVVGPLTRSFLVHVPAHRRVSNSGLTLTWPLVIVLHGSAGTGSGIEHQSGMDSLADAQRFLVAYPDGTGGQFGLYPSDWNAGTCCGAANRENIDDLGFISAIIKMVAVHVPMNPRRVYVAGFSSGGYMAYHVGCQLSATVAAIGVVEGDVAEDQCTPAKAVPLWAVHGTDDPEVGFNQGAPPPNGPIPVLALGLPPSIQFWSVLNGCVNGTKTTASADVVLTSLTPCTGADVDFYTIQGGTHGWPGGPDDPGSQPPMNELKTSVLMWQFFVRHRR